MKRFLFLLTTGLLIITNESIAAPSEQRRAEALKVFKEYPDKISPEIQEKILAQQVVLGMTPYDAYLAAGAHYYKVSADPEKWKRNADPYKVMWAQSVAPDNSEIWMTFETDTQYPGQGRKRFEVRFALREGEGGRNHQAGGR